MRNRGFTLIELMISMALFGLIAAGAMSLVIAGSRAQSHSSRVDIAQGALRTGMDFITRDVLMASAGASSGLVTTTTGTFNTINFSTLNGNTIASDTLDLYLVDGSTAAQATGAVAQSATSIALQYEKTTTNFALTAPTSPPPFVQICDLKNAVVVPWSSSTATSINVTALPAATGLPFAANQAYILPSRHVVYSVSSGVFAVASSSLQNTSMLMMSVNGGTAEPLAEGIEDMQIAYGFDDNGDGIITDNSSTTDEWLWNNPGDTVGTHLIANLRAIRITLVAKSTSVDAGAVFPVYPAAEDRPVGTVKDGFIRRVLRTEIAVRNFNL